MALDMNLEVLERVKWQYFAQPVPSQTSTFRMTGKMIQNCMLLSLPCSIKLTLESLKYLHQLVSDGNFSQAHLAQKNPGDDVWLTDGELFIMA